MVNFNTKPYARQKCEAKYAGEKTPATTACLSRRPLVAGQKPRKKQNSQIQIDASRGVAFVPHRSVEPKKSAYVNQSHCARLKKKKLVEE